MKFRTADKMALWQASINALGYYRGYSVIGLKMILRAVTDRRLMQAVTRRKESQNRYNCRYYRERKDELREYKREYNHRYYHEHKDEHAEYMRQWRANRLQGVTD